MATNFGTTLSLRELNRRLLARQMLLERAPIGPAEAVSRLVAVQGQEANWPFVGLWTRLTDFVQEDLEDALAKRAVVRGTLLRGTQHLAAAGDYALLRAAVQPALDRLSRASYYRRSTDGVDPAELDAAAREVLRERGLIPRRELAEALVERFPAPEGEGPRERMPLAGAVEMRVPLLHGPDGVRWGSWWSRQITVAAAEQWLDGGMGGPQPWEAAVERMVRRYLGAFGPAGVKDVQTWSGVTRLKPVLERMRPGLRVFRDESGTELFDLPAGEVPEPDAAVPAPVRLLPAFDNAVLGHADRTRILPAEFRREVMPGWSQVHATVLVDGFVAGLWTVEKDGRGGKARKGGREGLLVRVRMLRRVSARELEEVVAEAERMRPFLGARREGGAGSVRVVVDQEG